MHAGGQRFDPASLHFFIFKIANRVNHSQSNGGVAQLARASGSYPGGRGFDPLRRYILLEVAGPLAQLVRADGS